MENLTKSQEEHYLELAREIKFEEIAEKAREVEVFYD